jgi:hypothetical protein
MMPMLVLYCFVRRDVREEIIPHYMEKKIISGELMVAMVEIVLLERGSADSNSSNLAGRTDLESSP